MNIKNLERAAEIADELPRLENARHILSEQEGASIEVTGNGGEYETIPTSVKMNVINVLNIEINHLKEELKTL